MRELIRQHSKKLVLGVGLLVFVFVLAGCSANISLSIDPNPIRFDEENLEQEVSVSLKTSGIGSVDIDSLDVLIMDEEGEEVYTDTVEVEESLFVVPGVEETVDFKVGIEDLIDEEVDEEINDEVRNRLYKDNKEKLDEEYRLRILVQGSINPTTEADIIFE